MPEFGKGLFGEDLNFYNVLFVEIFSGCPPNSNMACEEDKKMAGAAEKVSVDEATKGVDPTNLEVANVVVDPKA